MTRLRSPWRNSGCPGSISSFSWGRPGSVYISPCWSPAWRSEKQKVDVQRPLSESLEESSPDGHPLLCHPLLNPGWACPESRAPFSFPGVQHSGHTPWRSGRIGSVGVEEQLRPDLDLVWEACC